MITLQDFKLTDLIKLRDYFIELRNNYIDEIIGILDKNRYEILKENIDLIDSFIVREFQSIKIDTVMPKFHTKESIDKDRKEREEYNNQI